MIISSHDFGVGARTESNMTENTAPDLSEEDLVFPKRNREMMKYLITSFAKLLDPAKQAEFAKISAQLAAAIDNNCGTCAKFRGTDADPAAPPKDPRRQRFLLRLVVSQVSSLFFGTKQVYPRVVVEGLDRYLRKSLGDILYEDLNKEADSLLYRVNTNDDIELVQRINANSDWRRFADNIRIRVLLRFENFTQARKTFVTVIDNAVREQGQGSFEDHNFPILFDALFRDIFEALNSDESRLRLDYQFGDGTAKKIHSIVDQFRKKADKQNVEAAAAQRKK